MRFIDQNILLNIKPITIENDQEKSLGKDFFFKAFLDTCDVSFDLQTQQLVGFSQFNINDKLQYKTIRKVKLAFDVFSESREECIINFEYLEKFIDYLRPNMDYIGKAVVPTDNTIFGNYRIVFSGLPSLSSNLTGKDGYKIQLTNFSYGINKEMGYIEVPYYSSDPNIKYKSIYDTGNMKLIPIAYKLNIEGLILLDAKDAYKFGNTYTNLKTPPLTGQQITGDLNATEVEQANDFFIKIMRYPIETTNSTEQDQQAFYKIYKEGRTKNWINEQGEPTVTESDPDNSNNNEEILKNYNSIIQQLKSNNNFKQD